MVSYAIHLEDAILLMLTLRQISLTRGTKKLLEEASVSLYEKQKIGFVGRNGTGKSSLFSLLLGELNVDKGDCQLNAHVRISHLSQQIPEGEESALDFVLAGDEEYQGIQTRLNLAEKTGDDLDLIACHDWLSQHNGYSKPAQAAAILAGLGFQPEQQQHAVNQFSGGWRMRLNLARCLMKPADLLLLDEPTNHLDLEAIVWLEKWLKQFPLTVIVISHDREFLDALVSHVLHIEQRKLVLYTGNYSQFEQARAQQLALQHAMQIKQQKKIDHMMAYVERFRSKASKAKQAQSRLKAIEKMEVVAQAQIDSPFSFEFYPCHKAGKPLISCEQVSTGYNRSHPILNHIDLTLNPGDRIALLGPNGEGKSTLIKTLTGDLTPFSGEVHRDAKLNVGYFAQHQLEQLDGALSPVQTLQKLTPGATEQSIRDYLGGFNFIGDMAINPCHHFSGGEKARLALARLVWLKPNLLLLDEPTNHLDLDMRAAIEIGLQSYTGALILISHDRHLLRTAVDEFYLVFDHKVKPFQGHLDDYYQWLQEKQSSVQSQSTNQSNSYREKRNLQNRLKKIEQLTEQYEQQLKAYEVELADLALYEDSQQNQLQRILAKRDSVLQQLKSAEGEWLELFDQLEQLTIDSRS